MTPPTPNSPSPPRQERLSAFKNLALSSSATYFEAALGLLTSVLIARTLGPADFSYYAFAVWLSGWLIAASNHALTTTSIKFVAEARGAGAPALASALAHRMRRLQRSSSALVLLGFAIYCAVRPPAEWRGSEMFTAAVVGLAACARSAFRITGSIGKGYERFDVENISIMVMALLNAAMIVGWTFIDGGLRGYLVVYGVSSVVLWGAGQAIARRRGIVLEASEIPSDTQRRMIRQTVLTGLLVLLGLFANRTIETFFLKASAPAEAFAFFTIAGTLTKGAVDFLASGLAAILLPSMSRRFGDKGMSGLLPMVSEAVRYYWILGMVIAGLGIVAAPGILTLLYGEAFLGAIPAVVTTLVTAGLTCHIGALTALQTATERQADRLVTVLMILSVNLALAVLLIPGFGLVGAIATSSLCSGFQVIVSWLYVGRRTGARPPASAMLRTALACFVGVLSGSAVVPLFQLKWSWIPASLAFLAGYSLGLLFLRCLTHQDFALAAAIGARTGRLSPSIVSAVRAMEFRFAARK